MLVKIRCILSNLIYDNHSENKVYSRKGLEEFNDLRKLNRMINRQKTFQYLK